MPNIIKSIKNVLKSPTTSRKSKSTGDLSNSTAQLYTVKEKDLSKLHLAVWKGDTKKLVEVCRADKINLQDKEGR
jgi:hypothetical protein